MAEGKKRHDWELKSFELCQRYSVHAGTKSPKKEAKDFNPFGREKREEVVRVSNEEFFGVMRAAFCPSKKDK